MAFYPRILVVDDELEVLCKIYIGLLNKDYKVEASQSAEEILPRIKRFKPDLLIISKELPGLNDHEICKTIKQENITAIVLVNVKLEDIIHLGNCLVERVMEKPVDMEYLFNEIESLNEG